MPDPEEGDLMVCEGAGAVTTMDREMSTGILYHLQMHSAQYRPLDVGGTCPSRR